MGQSVLAVGHHFVGACARIMHRPQVRGQHRIAKKSRNKKSKKISKRNLPNVGMADYMALPSTTISIAVDIDIVPHATCRWHNINIHCYLCRDGCVECSNVVECALLVCALCQPVPPSIHPSLHLVDLF